ncbi:MAG: PDZ domain-containing protein [Flavobacteriales bacterium]
MKKWIAPVMMMAAAILMTTTTLAQGKAKVHIKKNVNGTTTEETREVNIAEGEDIQKVLQEIGVLDEFGQLKPGQEFEIKIDKYDLDNNVQNLHFFFSPDMMVPQPAPDVPGAIIIESETRTFLGVMLRQTETNDNGTTTGTGAYITEVIAGTAAEKAGLLAGDVITEIDKKEMKGMNDVINYVQSKKPGDKVDIQVQRDGKKKKVKAELGEKEMEAPMMFQFDMERMGDMDQLRELEELQMLKDFNFRFEADSITIFCPSTPNCICPSDSMKICQPFSWNGEGMAVKETAFLGVTPWYDEEVKQGVRVNVEGETSAEEMGLVSGDVIKKFNGVEVNSFDMLADEIGKTTPESEVNIEIEREGKNKTINGTIGKRSMSGFEDFRIFHDFKGMDEGGNYTYDYEFDMDAEDVQQHMEELLRTLDEQQLMLDEERQRILEEMERMDTEHDVVIIKIRIDEITPEELETVNENAEPKLSNANDMAIDEISFFPNPGDGVINLTFTTQDKSSVTITIYDAKGQQVYNELRTDFSGSYKNTIDISTQPAGTYYLQILQNGKSYSKKIVKGQ